MSPIAQRLAQAMEHHRAGRLREAEALYRAILNESPREAHALHLLGVLAHQVGRHQDAMDLIGRALTIHGPHAVFHSNLAAVYLAAGQLIEAEAHARDAIRLQPDLADAHYNLGVALSAKGQIEEAAAAFRAALRLQPGHAAAARDLDALPQGSGNLAAIIPRLRQAVRLDPSNAPAHNDLGFALLAAGRADQAMPHLQEAVRLKPDFAEAYLNLGVAHQHLDQVDRAVECFQVVLRIDSTHVRARNNLGYALEAPGKIEEAVAEFRTTLRQDPTNSQALFSLSELAVGGHYRFSAREMKCLRKRAARADLPVDDLCRYNFALAHLLDKAGRYNEAFEHARRANELRQEIDRRCGVAFDPDAHRRLVDRLIATFTPAWFERVRDLGVDSELPIFVVGMLRSGTSLAEQVLASHPQIHGAGELRDVAALVAKLSRRLGTAEEFPESLAHLDAVTCRTLAEGHLHRLRQLGGEAVRVIDKFPLNFLHLGVLATLFPRARVIHCRRDPVDTCLSCYFQNFAGPFPFTLDLRHLGAYYREYERLMAHWARVLPMPIFELNYEELTADQEATTRRLVDFCGLEWDERCLRFDENRRVVWTASILQVRRPMYRSSVGRWKRYETQLQPLLDVLRACQPPRDN